jgi:hypothetical protein
MGWCGSSGWLGVHQLSFPSSPVGEGTITRMVGGVTTGCGGRITGGAVTGRTGVTTVAGFVTRVTGCVGSGLT